MWRKVTWIVLLLGGAAGFVWAVVTFQDKGMGAAIAVISIVTWITFGVTTSHLLSLRRKILRQHLRTVAKRTEVVTLERSGNKEEGFAIKFHDMPAVAREAIVLPADVMEVVERNVLGLLKHGPVLRASGRATRHGVLLHGPPGTGKTLVTRYLANACADYTVILITGRHLSMIRESCQLAELQ